MCNYSKLIILNYTNEVKLLIFLKKLYLYLEILNLFKKGPSLDSNKVQYNTTNEHCDTVSVALILYGYKLPGVLQ